MKKQSSALKEIAVMFEPFTVTKFKKQYDDDTIRYHLEFVTIDNAGQVRNPGSWEEDRCEFNDLKFSVYIRTGADRSFESFGTSCDFRDVYCVDGENCRRMLKMLTRISKVDANLPIRPASFGQFVALIASGLGAKRYVRTIGSDRGWHNENQYHFSDIKYLADQIDSGIEEERERLFPKPSIQEEVA